MNETLKRKDIKRNRNRRAYMKRCLDIKKAKEVCLDRDLWRRIVFKKSVTKSISEVIKAANESFWILMGPCKGLCLVDLVREKCFIFIRAR